MDVAKAMEKALEEVWCKEVDRFAEAFNRRVRKGPQSVMSPPSGSVTMQESEDLLLDMVEI